MIDGGADCAPRGPAVAAVDYRLLFESHPDPVAILDGAGAILQVNQAADTVLHGQVPCDTAPDLVRLGIDPDTFVELARRAREEGPVSWEFACGDAAPRQLEARLLALPLDDAARGAYLWVAHDVTERVHLEQARQQLVHMIVHDLRVPLGNVLNSLDLVLTAWRERDVTLPAEQVLDIGLHSAHRMDLLINDILDSARLQARERDLVVDEIDAAALLREAVEALTSSAERRGQAITVEIMPDLPPLVGDADLLRRVLVNLVNNAVKYTQEGGRITVRVTVDDDAMIFAVADTGRGIAPEDQAHIFDLFYRGGARRAKGAGIGLAFCKLAVEAHGGRIWFETTVGNGSSFYFTIPRVLPERAIYKVEDGS